MNSQTPDQPNTPTASSQRANVLSDPPPTKPQRRMKLNSAWAAVMGAVFGTIGALGAAYISKPKAPSDQIVANPPIELFRHNQGAFRTDLETGMPISNPMWRTKRRAMVLSAH